MKIISIEITESPLILPNAGVIHTLSGKKIYRSVKLLEKEVPNGRKRRSVAKALTNSIVDIYTLPDQFEAIVDSVIICNTTSSNINGFLYFYEGSTTTQFLIVNNKQIAGNDF